MPSTLRDYDYETLYEKAKGCGALTKEFPLELYGRDPRPKRRARVLATDGLREASVAAYPFGTGLTPQP